MRCEQQREQNKTQLKGEVQEKRKGGPQGRGTFWGVQKRRRDLDFTVRPGLVLWISGVISGEV